MAPRVMEEGPDQRVIAIIIIVLSSIFSVAVIFVIPIIQGVVVRYRAQYAPRRVQLGEDGAAPADQRDIIGFFPMFKRVKKMEGWAGLYKGTMPFFLAAFLAVPAGDPKRHFPSADLIFRSVLFLPLVLAFIVAQNRAVVTPYRLRWFSVHTAYRALCSSTERDEPLWIPFGPGNSLFKLGLIQLLAGVVLQLGFMAALGAKLHTAIIVGVEVAFVIVFTAIFSPLQVLFVRLSIQRRGSDDTSGDIAPLYSTDEPTIPLRPNDEPYTGVKDCWKKIRQEEGWGALYRGWWLVLLSALSAVSAVNALAGSLPGPLRLFL